MEDNTFQTCMYGSDRDEWTTIKSTKGLYTSIRKKRDGKHQPLGCHRKLTRVCTSQHPWKLHILRNSATLWLTIFSDFSKNVVLNFRLAFDLSTTQMTARNMRQFGKKQLPPLLSD